MAQGRKENKAGPLFGAGLLGGGVGVLLYKRSQNLWLSVLAAVLIFAADYVFLIAVNRWRAKRDRQKKT